MRTVAIIVATEPGTGFTRSKYLEPVRGEALIQRVAAEASRWPVDEVIVVLGPDAEEIVDRTDLAGATIVIDPEWREGIAAALRVATDLVLRGPTTDRAVVALADQPGVGADTVGALLDRSAGQRAVVPKYRYRRGWPVVVTSDLWDMLLGMEGPADLHAVLETHPTGVDEIWFDRLEPPRMLHPRDFAQR